MGKTNSLTIYKYLLPKTKIIMKMINIKKTPILKTDIMFYIKINTKINKLKNK